MDSPLEDPELHKGEEKGDEEEDEGENRCYSRIALDRKRSIDRINKDICMREGSVLGANQDVDLTETLECVDRPNDEPEEKCG